MRIVKTRIHVSDLQRDCEVWVTELMAEYFKGEKIEVIDVEEKFYHEDHIKLVEKISIGKKKFHSSWDLDVRFFTDDGSLRTVREQEKIKKENAEWVRSLPKRSKEEKRRSTLNFLNLK